MPCQTPTRKTMCATCPFRAGSPHADLAPYLTDAAMYESRICHSTGTNGIYRRTGKPEELCRGVRDIQLKMMHALKVIDVPTDEAWDAKRKELGC